ncbi:mycothiol-dependent nitroreductase Rv2466c family protein [Blastococcus sp. SYSU D00813]
MADADLRFYFDPVCPFAWMTSEWVRIVAARRRYLVEWRFISLRLLNAHVDYAAQFPPDYEAGHTDGLRLLRVAARVRDEHGPEAVDRLYRALGERIFHAPEAERPAAGSGGTPEFVGPVLAELGLPAGLATALDDEGWDAVLQDETEEALRLTGRDVGTPILHFRPPEGTAFFGPVISRLPAEEDAVELWDHVVALAAFPGFAELKRSLRERPQLPSFGVRPEEVGREEDWHGGSRRQRR